MLQVITSIEDIKQRIKTFKENQLSIGFIPTMGALHEGHLSLVRQAKEENDKVVVSIFVNPLQFGINEDFTRYPRTFDNDCKLLSKEDVDIVFNPKAPEMYPNGFCTSVVMEHLEDRLCGKSRPGHFRGCCYDCAEIVQFDKSRYCLLWAKRLPANSRYQEGGCRFKFRCQYKGTSNDKEQGRVGLEFQKCLSQRD